MKTKGIKLSIIMVVLSLVCGLGFAFQPSKKIGASAAAQTSYTSKYMDVEGTPTLTTEEAGETSGYSVEELGHKNVEISTVANPGFVLKGWYIVYSERATDNSEYLLIEDAGYYSTKCEQIYINPFMVENKSAKLLVETVGEDLQIEPVFDYEYYTISYNDINTGSITQLPTQYKYGDVVSFGSDVLPNVNVDAKSVKVDGVAEMQKVTETGELAYNSYRFTVDNVTGRTTKYEVKFTVSTYSDIAVEFDYDNLYKVDLELYLGEDKLVDDETTEDDAYSQILSIVNVEENTWYKQLSDVSYFVKTGANFKINCLRNYAYTAAEGGTFIYYNFQSLDDNADVYANYNDIYNDKIIKVVYNHYKYNIKFQGAIYNAASGTLEVNNAINVHDEILKTRVDDEFIIDDTYLENNIGHTFVGFAVKNKLDIYNPTSTLEDVRINEEKPEDVTIYVCYTATLYTIKIDKASLTSKSLINESNATVYPISLLNVNGETRSIAELLDESNANALVFENFTIGNTVNLNVTENRGFIFNGFYVQGDAANVGNTFVLDEEFLTGKTTEIILYSSAEYKTYTFNYVIKEKEDVLMANINLANTAELEALYTNPEFKITTTTDENESRIKVESVRLYTKFVLESVANKITEEGSDYYVFNWYTIDEKSRLTGVNTTTGIPDVYSLDYILTGEDITVYVVYSAPSTSLKVEFFGISGEHGVTFTVAQNGSISETDGVYKIETGNKVLVSLSNITNNSNLFGYKFYGYKLATVNASTETVKEEKNTLDAYYEFTPDSSALYVLTIKFTAIEYLFNVNVRDGNNVFSNTLTIEDPTIQFAKSEGNYVERVYILNKNNSEYVRNNAMEQSNDSRNGLFALGTEVNLFSYYYYTLSETEFKNIVENHGRDENSDGILEIYIEIVYSLYKYNVGIKYVKYYNNTLNNQTGIDLVYPEIKLFYTLDGTTNEVSTALVEGLLFEEIPYGANVQMVVTTGASAGFVIKGWYYFDNPSNPIDNEHAGRERNILNINADYKFAYRVDFIEYEIKLNYQAGQGNPTVNDQTSVLVKMGDSVAVNANAVLANGYIFDSIKYARPVYTEYVYDETTWETDKTSIYVYDGYYVLNTDDVYNEEQDYFVLSYEDVVLSNGAIGVFNVKNFKVENIDGKNVVILQVNYKSVEMSVVNNSSTTFALAKVNLTNDDLADYITIATKNGNPRNLNEVTGKDKLVTVDDTLTITIQINREAYNADLEETYDLTRGLILSSVMIGSKQVYNIEMLSEAGAYKIEVLVSEFITESFARAEEFVINFTFIQKNKNSVTVTTNMAGSSSFIASTSLTIDGPQDVVSKNNPSAHHDYDFLDDINVSINLETFNTYFKVKSVKIYHSVIKQENLLKETDFNDFYLDVVRKTVTGKKYAVIDFVNFKVVDKNMIIEFVAEPILYVEKVEVDVEQEVRFKDRTYTMDANGNGVAQPISLGENPNSFDIAGYGINANDVGFEIYKNNIKCVDGAINVGDYEIRLVLKTNADHWLQHMVLPYKITLRVVPLVVKLSSVVPETFKQEYNRSSIYDLGLTFDNTNNVWKSKDGKISFKGETLTGTFNLKHVQFNTDYSAKLTITDNGVQVEQKDVTNSLINITISGLRIINNNNIVLSPESETIIIENCVLITPKVVTILNLEVYDKVYDGKTIAAFGVAKDAEDYKIEYNFKEDDVYLIPDRLKATFSNEEIGSDKTVTIDARTALGGKTSVNYVVGETGMFEYKDKKSIYPYSLHTTIKDHGTITITNRRGLTDPTKADLIPIGAILKVELIKDESLEYVSIYEFISSFLSRTTVYSVGYKLTMVNKNGKEIAVNNDLYITLPGSNEITGALSLSGEISKHIDYTKEDGNILIDMNQINEDISYLLFTKNKPILELWQIILISVGAIVLISGGVIAFVIIRKKQALSYNKFDKI